MLLSGQESGVVTVLRRLCMVVLFVLPGCSTYNGVTEFEAYRKAFDSSHQVGNAILDIFATSERRLFLNSNPPRASVYDPDYAPYYVDSIDPPGTAAFRRALDSVKAYNDILFGLASGETVEALSARLMGLSASLDAAASETSALLGGSNPVKVLGGLDARLGAATEVVKFALRYKSRADFQKFAIEYNPVIQDILVSLRDGTEIIFPILTRDITASISGVDQKKISIYRKLLSDWVLSLETTIAALNRVSLAIGSSSTLNSSVAAFTRSAIDLETTTSAARRHLAELAAN